jgi:hypothetical protein
MKLQAGDRSVSLFAAGMGRWQKPEGDERCSVS